MPCATERVVWLKLEIVFSIKCHQSLHLYMLHSSTNKEMPNYISFTNRRTVRSAECLIEQHIAGKWPEVLQLCACSVVWLLQSQSLCWPKGMQLWGWEWEIWKEWNATDFHVSSISMFPTCSVNSSQLKMPNISSLSPSLVCLTFAGWKPYRNPLVQQVINLSAERVQFRVGLCFLIFDFIQTHNVEQNLGT